MTLALQGLGTAIYPASHLEAAKRWWSERLGVERYFDKPFYVGYSVAGYELALLPDTDPADGVLTYWGVHDVPGAVLELRSAGAVEHPPVSDVGDGIPTATVRTPDGNIVGPIRNPHFTAAC